MLAAGLEGFVLGAGLIIAIGAQNAFVLRQGVRREHVFLVAAICASSDALLIAVGVAGVAAAIAASPALVQAVTWAGAGFLVAYGVLAVRRALHPDALRAADGGGSGRAEVVAACLAFTFLNPHVYLDTVLVLGGLSARYAGAARVAYGAGAALASFVWFFGLAYGARLLAPLLARTGAWRVLDGAVGAIMFAVAAALIARLL